MPFPKCEVAGVLLCPGCRLFRRLQVFQPLPCELAVGRPGAHIEVDVAGSVAGAIRVPVPHEPVYECQDLRYVTCRGRADSEEDARVIFAWSLVRTVGPDAVNRWTAGFG